jgi:molecular chaperone DnaK (HSP70)
MTKDNFKIGEFILNGVTKAPRGIPDIEVKFTVDVNGIITVVAEDKDKEHKSSITITSNKNRLKAEKIRELVEEAKKYELEDKIEKNKKQLFYEIDDLCSNVKENLNFNELKLSEADKKIISSDISIIEKWLAEKKYNERDVDDYDDVIKRIKKRYGTLILRKSNECDNVKSNISGDNIQATTVYGNEEDEDEKEQIFEKIENDDLGLTMMSDVEKTELKQLRQSLIELCNSIHDVILSSNLKVDDTCKKNIRDLIDDTLLWVHIHQKPKKIDYKSKIDEINDECNKLMENKNIFEKNEISKLINSSRDELEQLCFTLKSSIECNIFSVANNKLDELTNYINNSLKWLIDIDAKIHEANYKKEKYDEPISEYAKRIENINDLCKSLYNNMVGVNLETEIFDNNNININNNDITYSGTSIADLKKIEK